ncbi:MAG: hypothetical protein IKO94_04605, partial [Selenomonadaceae bacterium]|nr:hypothetical protein [Selenomonadaceae bacterium]
MKLVAGERLRLADAGQFATVLSGHLEVYAVTKDKVSFRQSFLMEITAGDGAFPALDDFGRIDIMLYATEDAQVEVIP